jgi:lipopolysaccharide transport system ATP-binding protein
MANEVVIKVEKLSKSYLIGHQMRNGQESFREAVGRHARSVARAALDMSRGRQIVQGTEIEEFWALRDVSFEVQRGEVLGIIGRNGAGKSTLLKILSRITEPTSGRATIRGRVASLLEVGTGFHQDLTGRENIYLNGAILGMSRAEIKSKFDEIVDFAEIEKFLDTPVKRYSSGMYVRLAFAVAAHLEPEILIIDEVLAVGDVAFQRKCLGKMQDVANGGRTVLIVSHHMPMIRTLCSRLVVLASGTVAYDGGVADGIYQYLETFRDMTTKTSLRDRKDRGGDGRLRFGDAYVVGYGGVRNVVHMGEEVRIVLTFSTTETIRAFDVSLHIRDMWDQTVLRIATRETTMPFNCAMGTGSITCVIPRLALLSGSYSLLIAASVPPAFEYLDYITQATSFEVLADDVYGTGKVPEYGTFFTDCVWQCAMDSNAEALIANPVFLRSKFQG